LSFDLNRFFFLLFFQLPLNQWSNLFCKVFGLNSSFTIVQDSVFLFLWLSLDFRFQHTHHLFRHPVSFLLINIPGLADPEFSL
jgi:hypothetical protein